MTQDELKRGNYIHYTCGVDGTKKHLAQVTEVYETSYRFEHVGHGEKPFSNHYFPKPIEITKQWLLSLGFVKTPIGFVKSGFRLDKHKAKYIHELQNMYEAKTGMALLADKL